VSYRLSFTCPACGRKNTITQHDDKPWPMFCEDCVVFARKGYAIKKQYDNQQEEGNHV
jgi:hypothetical protein